MRVRTLCVTLAFVVLCCNPSSTVFAKADPPRLLEHVAAMGFGSTSIVTEDGTRTSYFVPSGLSGGFGGNPTTGIIAAIAIPNLLNAIDEEAYPGPTDGWGHTLIVWSDAEHYRIVSPGKDGEFERDWTGPIDDGGARTEFAADIVFADGQFVVWPEGAQQ